MAHNTFGRLFRVTTFGESTGPGVGLVIDGLPPRLGLDLEGVRRELRRRRIGAARPTLAPEEEDQVTVLSGLFEGQTTGAPLCMLISSPGTSAEDEAAMHGVYRPGHGDVTWTLKYGVHGWDAGGRLSGRETAARVAAGAVARQILSGLGVSVFGHVLELGGERAYELQFDTVEQNELRCADPEVLEEMREAVEAARREGDSLGAVVEVLARGVPAGWGDPVFDKLDARLAGALMSIGSVKGVEVGDGFTLTRMRGSEANDPITPEGFDSNRAGGVLGGISTGQELVLRLAVKPTPGIGRPQCTVDGSGNATVVAVASQVDPCVAPRVLVVAEAMVALVLVDAYFSHQAVVGPTR